jgi:thioredoxin reductase
MSTKSDYEVIVVGGSYAGLAAALSLGRALRRILVIDSGKPCNRQTPHSHNFLTRDGETPAHLAAIAREQVLKYPSIELLEDRAVSGVRRDGGFEIAVAGGATVRAERLLFATGVEDIPLPIPGFTECWGKSVLHCPYCHGYEVHGETLGVIANGDDAFHFVPLLYQWSRNLTLLSNGPAGLGDEQRRAFAKRNIPIVEEEIVAIEHQVGQIERVRFQNGASQEFKAVFARAPFRQHCSIPEQLGCALDANGFIAVNELQETTQAGVYAAGDNTTMMRSVAIAVAAGNRAGAFLNRDLALAAF